ncbi:MAG TPA: TetR/AcrR family transcriptional regulator [Sphingopyxis sp.]|jgi:AcrR family transcriptional regulator|uniref:TetR/AcrR family transcriptional regulator n=1 Tax=Sphingopyxis sp. TaxID=1908224 RepID=UPI002E100728|nr:TetR/AcrR family transcriptional regulator [Sphingopyxis sp.]
MADRISVNSILAVVARTGFRKASMEELALATGVSRQALYNRFGSKGALIDWATQSLIDQSLAVALDALENPAAALVARLATALDAWIGEHMAMLRASPHGIDAAPMAAPDASEAVRGAERKLVTAMANAIRRGGPGTAVARAGSLAQALCWTAKGLVHAAPDHAAFRRELELIVGAVLAR